MKSLMFAAACCLVLAACGGGGGEDVQRSLQVTHEALSSNVEDNDSRSTERVSRQDLASSEQRASYTCHFCPEYIMDSGTTLTDGVIHFSMRVAIPFEGGFEAVDECGSYGIYPQEDGVTGIRVTGQAPPPFSRLDRFVDAESADVAGIDVRL